MTHEPTPSSSFNGGSELSASSSGVHFPGSTRSSQSNSLSRVAAIGIGPPPSRQQPPLQDTSLTASHRVEDRRRRARSAQGVSFGQAYDLPPTSRKRLSMLDSINGTTKIGRPRRVTMSTQPLAGVDEFEPSVFSDEYDLSHEDPKIIEEVQHALKLKMRREVRQHAPLAEARSTSSMSSELSSRHQFKLSPSLPRVAKGSLESELDFSPSIGVHRLHPVPISFNGGHTLDWGWSEETEELQERKWPIPIPKRRTRDKQPQIPAKDVLDRQQVRWSERIANIETSATPHTLRKRDITRMQLQRRYQSLFSSLENGKEPLNPVRVVSWYSKLDPSVQTSLDQAEPFTWLRHLHDRHLVRTGRRFPWHMSALLVEQFLYHNLRETTVSAIPVNSQAISSTIYQSSSAARSFESASEIASHRQLSTSLSRRVSLDGNVSFEPFIDSSSRRSGGDESRRSFDRPSRHKKRTTLESARSSLYSAPSQPELASSPPNRSRVHRPAAHTHTHDSDGPTSPRPSISEDSIGGKRRKKVKIRRHPVGLDVAGPLSVPPEVLSEKESALSRTDSRAGAPISPEGQLLTARAQRESPPPSPNAEDETTHLALQSRTSSARLLRLRGYRTSLPSLRLSPTADDHWQQLAEEESVQLEYEKRIQILDNLTAQNIHERMVLQRVAASVKEYQKVVSRLSKSLRVPYTDLPEDLISALSHDPAAITMHTRQFKGYHAVDAIHQHLQEQAETIEKYLQQRDFGAMHLDPQTSVLESSIEILLQALSEVEREQPAVLEKTRAVADALDRVKKLHVAVKTEYNDAVAHTSVVYPEMSRIITLEDSYKNRYQQIWDIAMDFVTFMLDAVVPFWRNYGKVIGVDVQDFLIVPLYRNEFTGESKRYPITNLPRRSLRHWIALAFIFFCNITLWFFQARGVWSSCKRYYIPLLARPTFWFVTIPLYCMFVGIQILFVLLEATGVLLHTVVVLWWLAWRAGIVT